MNWSELTSKLNDMQKNGWSWSVCHSHGDFCARLWKNKEGTMKVSWTARQGKHVISELGNSPEDALTRVLSRHDKGTFDIDPPDSPPRYRMKRKDTPGDNKPDEPDPPVPGTTKD